NPILSATARGVGYPAPVPGAGYFILVPIVCLVASPSTSNQALFCSRRADRSRLDNVHLVCRTGDDGALVTREKLSADCGDHPNRLFCPNGIHGLPFAETGGDL